MARLTGCPAAGLLIALAALAAPSPRPAAAAAAELVHVDAGGVIRWDRDGSDVSLFGANYCLQSALDYRAAGTVHADRHRLAEQDMTHFARMGFDAVRLCFWGDWENSDAAGNLIANDHLDVLDYAIYQAKLHGVYILLSPITTYSSLWPDLKDDPAVVGFSRHFQKSELGTNPQAIAAQQNYLRQLLNHVNPYTRAALKDEPQILFVEMINEPWHHGENPAGSVRYINALVDAVRSTGCRKLTFHNLSQDFGMAGPINDSKVDGETFAWYPSGLNAGHQLHGNFLPYVDRYPPMMVPAVRKKPRLVYEFDLPDVISGYHYPAMARVFREAGAQWATMFSYDMLATAPYNLGWTTHLLNLVYTPRKAAAAVIASAAMHELPRGTTYGGLPEDGHFGPVTLSEPQDSAVLATPERFMYSNDTTAAPPSPAALRQVVGCGSSPVVRSDGTGVYFLDKIDAGRWRLELYPDVVQVGDPFHNPRVGDVKFRLIGRPVGLTIALQDLGDQFAVRPLNAGNDVPSAPAVAGAVTLPAGVYLLSGPGATDAPLPDRLGNLGMRDFVCPSVEPAPPAVVTTPPPEHSAGEPLTISAQVVDALPPRSVTLWAQAAGGEPQSVPMTSLGRYGYAADVRADQTGPLRYRIIVETAAGQTLSFPGGRPSDDAGGLSYQTNVIAPSAELWLFQAERDFTGMAQTREGWAQPSFVAGSSPGEQAAVVDYPAAAVRTPPDFTRSMDVGDRVAARATAAAGAAAVAVTLRGRRGPGEVHVTLVERDGSAWAADVKATADWQRVVVPLSALSPAKWVLLPEGYPGSWAYWAPPVSGPSDHPVPADIERLQLSLRKPDLGDVPADRFGVELESVALLPSSK
jgi:hypothetical protein